MTAASDYVALLVALLVMITVVAVTVTAGGTTRQRSRRRAAASERARHAALGDDARPRVAVVVNPTKFVDIEPVRDEVSRIVVDHGWAEPLWLETTEAEPGTRQARDALDAGVDLVCALGGDGTVRSVAAALVGSSTPMGLLPAGTGNILARNLALPVESRPAALHTALTGATRRVDVGTLTLAPAGPGGEGEPEGADGREVDDDALVFLVMAGIGFDADVMAQAPERLKARVGWPAYVVSGLRNLNGPRFGVDIAVDGGKAQHRRVRSVVIGNVGTLPGGVQLLPDAVIDDGTLDVVAVAPKGVIGWGAVIARLVTRTRRGHRLVEHTRCRRLRLDLAEDQQVQLDGDVIGRAAHLRIALRPRALQVRVARPAPRPAP